MAFDDIIVAPATPAGPSGVAVYRISGKTISAVMYGLGLPKTLEPRTATLCMLREKTNGKQIDQALVVYFPAPHSFTGEEVLELHTHGGAAIRRMLLDVLTSLPGCRIAEPGEFSKRAFMHGKMDLLQAEGIADIIAAQTASQHQLALRQLGGDMSEKFAALRRDTVKALALLEAYIDFPDEDIPESTLQEVETSITAVGSQIDALLEEPPCGELIRDGISVAIIGPPNAGKSSLMNRLAKRDVAIVSEVAGTTRDRIETYLNLNGYLVKLIDTAGIRETKDLIELEGIRRAKHASDTADITLVIQDIVSGTKLNINAYGVDPKNTLLLLNKCDQPHEPPTNTNDDFTVIPLSAKTGEGIDRLLYTLSEMIERKMAACPSPTLTRARHRDALKDAKMRIAECNLRNMPLELSSEILRQAARAIGKVTGVIEVDQLLDVIFREFCIGK